jgi:endonuclease YncB( thermonuclease family)
MTGAGGPQAARLRAALDGREVACDPAEGGAYRCMLGSEDLASDLVGGGFARAAPDAPQPLRDAERQARADRRGLWGP